MIADRIDFILGFLLLFSAFFEFKLQFYICGTFLEYFSSIE